jgi:hypothetical protein
MRLNMSLRNEGDPRRFRVLLWAAAAAIVLLYLGPMFIRVFRPPPDTYPDFVQEWLSARCYWQGEPVYLLQRGAMRRVTGQDLPQLDERPWNAHPPVAVLVALPFGLIADYRTAHLIWNLTTFALFLIGLALIARELRLPLHWWSVCPVIVLVIADNPVISQLWHAQLNFLLAFLLTVAWVAHRNGYRSVAGIATGLAIAIKLFPGLVLVYFVAARMWREALVTVVAALGANLVALGLFGVPAFETYIREVLPSLEVFRGSWGNASLTGYVTRVVMAFGADSVAVPLVSLGQLAIVIAIVQAARRATTLEPHDRGFALAIAGMPLASPIAWAYYFVLLALPLLLLWQRLASGWTRAVFAASVVILLLPEGLYPGLYNSIAPGSPDVSGLANHLPTPRDIGLNLIGLAMPTLALVAVFLLIAVSRLREADGSTVETPQSAS